MGNNIGGSGRRKAKVMKIDGQTLKFKTPIRAGDIVKDYPGHVLLESNSVKQFGIRARPLEPQQELSPKNIYFLVELPKFPDEKDPRRVRSEISMSAKDRLECLMLSRRSASDLSIIRPPPTTTAATTSAEPDGGGLTRVKMRLPRAQVAKLMEESRDEAEVAEKIMNLYMEKEPTPNLQHEQGHWKPGLGGIGETFKAREKRVNFVPIEEGEIRLASQ